MNGNRATATDATPNARPVRLRFAAPQLTEMGSLATLTRMDGIGHGGAISGQSAP